MDDVYLLNNPFTFQSMEKHSAYCAMMRLGLKVPDTWLVPHKQPPWNERFPTTAARYNRSFDLADVGDYVGYPLYLKPFDGGQWRGVSRARNQEELRRRYDESGEQLMHVQSAVEDFEVFARSLSIGAETQGDVVRARPADVRPLPGEARLLDGRAGLRGRDDLQGRERVLPLGVQLVRVDRSRRERCSRSTTPTPRPMSR